MTMTATTATPYESTESYRLEPLASPMGDGYTDGNIDWATECAERSLGNLSAYGAPDYLIDNVRDYVALLAEAARS